MFPICSYAFCSTHSFTTQILLCSASAFSCRPDTARALRWRKELPCCPILGRPPLWSWLRDVSLALGMNLAPDLPEPRAVGDRDRLSCFVIRKLNIQPPLLSALAAAQCWSQLCRCQDSLRSPPLPSPPLCQHPLSLQSPPPPGGHCKCSTRLSLSEPGEATLLTPGSCAEI